ncbi:MAG TPA: acyltransferase family protein [Stellaceae bacterium]|jgi:peptidoglycan/LPS O-acetylase OafA/YrhL
MTTPPAPAERRVEALDSLRGIAILMVLASHLLPPALRLPAVPPALEGIGRGGVILFFLLSGYLICGNVRRQPMPVFLRRRLFLRRGLGRWLGFPGMTSYNNYLWHGLIAGPVFASFGGGPATAVAALVASTVLAVVLYRTFEQPLVRLTHRWEAAAPRSVAALPEPAAP